MAREPQILQRVAEEAGLPVPAVWAHDDTRELLPRDLLVLERLPGAPPAPPPAESPDALDGLLRDLGGRVRALHAIAGPQFGILGPQSPMEPERHWYPAFETMAGHLLDDAGSCGALDPGDAARLGALVYRLRSVFPSLRSARLCHRGLAWERLLVEGGRLTGILGWGRAVWGDPEIEFAALDAAGMARPSFWEGYGAPRPSDSPAKIRRKLYILFDLVDRIATGRRRGADPAAEETARKAALQLAAELERE
jgi:aminoglycoside phosphotransferase (APT) family kinase protein